MITITPKKWGEFQHYKDRRPPWIKLQRTLLDDYDFACLPLASRALAPCLWLLASEFEGGHIPADLGLLVFRLHCPAEQIIEAVIPLIEKGFFIASAPLAWRKQETRLERETQEQEQEELPIATQSGAKAPEGKAVDPLWHTGLAFLTRKGIPEKQAREFVGKLKREVGDIPAGALLAQAEAEDITEPIPWLSTRAVSARKNRTGGTHATHRESAAERVARINEEAEQRGFG